MMLVTLENLLNPRLIRIVITHTTRAVPINNQLFLPTLPPFPSNLAGHGEQSAQALLVVHYQSVHTPERNDQSSSLPPGFPAPPRESFVPPFRKHSNPRCRQQRPRSGHTAPDTWITFPPFSETLSRVHVAPFQRRSTHPAFCQDRPPGTTLGSYYDSYCHVITQNPSNPCQFKLGLLLIDQ